MSDNPDRLVSASLLRLRLKSPFFGTLALFARFVPTPNLTAAGTDGKDIFFNAAYLRSLPPAQQDGLLLHAVLHAALLHVPRRRNREPHLWNTAADIVVNGIVAAQEQCELPPDAPREPALEQFSVEEIYALLQETPDRRPAAGEPDLLVAPPDTAGDSSPFAPPHESGEGERPQPPEPLEPPDGSGDPGSSQQTDLENYWRHARQQAATLARTSNRGDLPAGVTRELEAIAAAQLDWRSYLWRHLGQTPTDFSGFDRRFVGRGLYLDALQEESLQVFIAIDTSGSIGDRLLSAFLGEVRSILAAYPHIEGQLYYADARLYGPYAVADSTLAPPIGGGGTSFVPFFEGVAASWDRSRPAVCTYLTDGYGRFPDAPPELPVLWIVAPGGLPTQDFPFGDVARLLDLPDSLPAAAAPV